MKRKNRIYRHHPAPDRGINWRLAILSFVLIGCFLSILLKLVVLQILDHTYYKEKARKNAENRHEVPARRGTIYDRKGRELAKDILLYSVAVNKKYIKNKSRVEKELAAILDIALPVVRKKVRSKENFVYVAHKVIPAKAEKLKNVQDPGIYLEKRFLRVYPYGMNGAHLIGFCDVDNNALGGVEYQYNQVLEGRTGWSMYQRDAFGNQVPHLDYPGEEPIDGMNVRLTIDMDFQAILDEVLEVSVLSSNATEGIAILMNPATAEILALSNYPCFDPNYPNRFTAQVLKNRAVTDILEPGSTFKIITLAAAIEQLQLNVDRDIFFCENGEYPLYGRVVSDYKEFGWLTPRRIFENSSNIGTMKIAEKLKKEDIYRYARNFGFGMPSGIDLPGESPGILTSLSKFSKTTPYYMSIGYEVGVTAIQLINAYACLANRGVLGVPRVMNRIDGEEGREIRVYRSEPVRQVLTEQTTALMSDILTGAVEEGSGQEAAVEGLQIAGKTGTAQLYDTKNGRYHSNKHLASFVGYFPVHSPQYVLLVMIRNPKGAYYGGLVAAPAFHLMAKRIVGIAPVSPPVQDQLVSAAMDSGSFSISQLKNLDIRFAKKILDDLGFSLDAQPGPPVEMPNRSGAAGDKIENIVIKNHKKMPSVTGLTLKEALHLLSRLDINASVEGHGVVIKQYPMAGRNVNEKSAVKLVCHPS